MIRFQILYFRSSQSNCELFVLVVDLKLNMRLFILKLYLVSQNNELLSFHKPWPYILHFPLKAEKNTGEYCVDKAVSMPAPLEYS